MNENLKTLLYSFCVLSILMLFHVSVKNTIAQYNNTELNEILMIDNF